MIFEERVYEIDRNHLLEAARDMAAMQSGGKTVAFNEREGTVVYNLRMYGLRNEYRISARDGDGITRVSIETDDQRREKGLGQQFTLLEKFLTTAAHQGSAS